jgi:hypothetical protein
MPSFGTVVSHALGQSQALDRLKSFVQEVRDQYGDQVSEAKGDWQDNVLDFSLTTLGLTIKGTLTVEEAAARVAGHLPLAAAFFRGQIERQIADELQRALG